MLWVLVVCEYTCWFLCLCCFVIVDVHCLLVAYSLVNAKSENITFVEVFMFLCVVSVSHLFLFFLDVVCVFVLKLNKLISGRISEELSCKTAYVHMHVPQLDMYR